MYVRYLKATAADKPFRGFMTNTQFELLLKSGEFGPDSPELYADTDITPTAGRDITAVRLNAGGDKVTSYVYAPIISNARKAALAYHLGLVSFSDFVKEHSVGVDPTLEIRVLRGLWRLHQGAHMIAGSNLTKAQKAAIFGQARFGPADFNLTDGEGNYNANELFKLYEKMGALSNAQIVALIGQPRTYVDPVVANWNNGVPNRLNLVDMAAIPNNIGAPAAVAQLNIGDFSWLAPL